MQLFRVSVRRELPPRTAPISSGWFSDLRDRARAKPLAFSNVSRGIWSPVRGARIDPFLVPPWHKSAG